MHTQRRPEYWKNSLDIKYMLYGSDDQAFIQATGEDELKDWEKLRKQDQNKGGTMQFMCSGQGMRRPMD
jgi:hypothetical protein